MWKKRVECKLFRTTERPLGGMRQKSRNRRLRGQLKNVLISFSAVQRPRGFFYLFWVFCFVS